jgi:hypothetical protein
VAAPSACSSFSEQVQQRSLSGIPPRAEREEQQKRWQHVRDRVTGAGLDGVGRDAQQRERDSAGEQPTASDCDAPGQNDTTT